MHKLLGATMISLAGLPNFLGYFLVSAILMLMFGAIYIRITPYKEITLIRQGNTAAAMAFGGAILGYALPLSIAISHSASLLDMIVWAVVSLVIQLGAYWVVSVFVPKLREGIPGDVRAQGIFLGAVSIAAGMINAACMI